MPKAALYIRSQSGYSTPSKLVDLTDNSRYVLSWYEGGKKRFHPVGKSATAAQLALIDKTAELERAAITQPSVTPVGVTTVRASVIDYLDAIKDRVGNDGYGASPRTLAAYTKRLSYLLEFDGTTPLGEVDQKYWERYRKFLRTRLQSDRYVHNVLQAASIWARTIGNQTCASVLKTTAYPPKPVRAYTDEQMKTFFTACTPAEELVFRFYLYSMAREREVAFCEVGDLLFAESKFWIQPKPHRGFRLKGKRSGQAVRGRKVPLPRWFMDKLKEYTKGNGDDTLLFPNSFGRPEGHFLRICQNIAKRAGLPHTEFGLHRWRKTGASILYMKGIPVPLISKYLGHEDLKVTQSYLDISDEATTEMVDKVSEIFAE